MKISFVNENDPGGPEVEVVEIKNNVERPEGIPELDGEPFTQFVRLDCGHYLYNTYGNKIEEKIVGQKLNCYLCGKKKHE